MNVKCSNVNQEKFISVTVYAGEDNKVTSAAAAW